jgi:thiol-disulfide isomerase/thioredoxin
MNQFNLMKLGILALCCAAIGSGADRLTAGGKDGKVELKAVQHAELVKAIAAHKGKVVLVDFWATFCPPCMEKFPKVVAMHEKKYDKGLIVISVTFDEMPKHDKALEFLMKNKATFANYRVEDADKCQDQWDFVALPTYLVFGKDGKLANKFTIDPDAKSQFTMGDVAKAVEKQMK